MTGFALGAGLLLVPEEADFTPAALFAGGAAGGFYDPSDLSSMFQDAAGTIPAAIDAPVGRIRDRSGRGNHLTQNTAAARPMLRQDASGRRWLEFDGVDDWLSSSSSEFDFTSAFVAATALRFTGGASFTALTGKYGGGAAGWDIGIMGGVPRVSVRGPSTLDTLNGGFASLTGADAALTAEISPTAIVRTVNGARVTTNGVWTPATASTAPFALGQRGNDGANRFVGRVYALAVIGRALGDGETDQLRGWMAARAGVVV